jgi:phenylalanyl-tRNA synthetase beta chain
MKFDLGWLTELVDRAPEPDAIAERLTACGFLVELRERGDGDEVWEVEVTTNRPDAMNHRGLARELAVATGARLRPLEVELAEGAEPVAAAAAVEVAEPELCARYLARVVRGVTVVESPAWLKRRLERCGVRPINAVVDATNYVLLELGQPLHAFDLEGLAGRRIVVRRAASGERLTTLDGEARELDPATLVIADAERAVALAGIMGGANSEISAATTDLLIESAHFDPLTVRRAARRLGMHTEASHRFERGCDPEMAGAACDVAAAMIARLCGGEVCRGRIDVDARSSPPRTMELSVAALSRFAGLEIALGDVLRILEGLGFEPRAEGDRVVVSPPSHRVDVDRVADLYEEVIRHVGYDRVPAQLPVLSTPPGHRHPNWELVDRARGAAVGVGLAEVMTFAFIDPDDDALAGELPLPGGAPLPLANPLARTQSVMRRSLLPGLLAGARGNLNRGERTLAIFEQGRVFFAGDGSPVERERLALVLAGTRDGGAVGFGELKGLVEELLDRISFPAVAWRRGGGPWLDEAEGAVLVAGDAVVGLAGLLAAGPASRWELRQPVYLAEIELASALAPSGPVRFKPVPRFPSVVADMTIEHPAGLAFATLDGAVRELASELVEAVELVGEPFTGEKVPVGRVRTTLRLVYRHPERSLTQDEVNAAQAGLRERLGARLGVSFA